MKTLSVLFCLCFALLFFIPLEVGAQPTKIEFNISPGCAAVGTPVTITAESSLGGQFYKYWVNTVPWCQPGAANWQMIQDWSTAKTATWTPTVAGIHTVVVWVSNVAADQPCEHVQHGQTGATFTVGGTSCEDPVQVSVTPSNGVVNQPVTVTAEASGTNLQYRFWVNNVDFCTGAANWTLLQDWTTANTCTFTPPAPGIYTLIVWAVSDTNNACPSQGGVVYDVPDGPVLYANNCASCHGALAPTGWSAAAIQNAINRNRGGMGSLSFLTPVQVQAIATALAP
jgi:hypothetical protein